MLEVRCSSFIPFCFAVKSRCAGFRFYDKAIVTNKYCCLFHAVHLLNRFKKYPFLFLSSFCLTSWLATWSGISFLTQGFRAKYR